MIFASSIYTTGIARFGSTTSGVLNYNGDKDWFKIALVKDVVYQYNYRL